MLFRSSQGGGLYARTVLGVGLRDLTAGFKAWKADTLRGIDLPAVRACERPLPNVADRVRQQAVQTEKAILGRNKM